jgi:hypothetical protein
LSDLELDFRITFPTEKELWAPYTKLLPDRDLSSQESGEPRRAHFGGTAVKDTGIYPYEFRKLNELLL